MTGNQLSETINNAVMQAVEIIEGNKPKIEKYYTKLEVMNQLNISESTFRRHQNEGVIKIKKIGGSIRISQKEVSRLIKEYKSLNYRRA